tara:strand:+ start:465 stop:716 length:252 start_codon:yes stop_codon:yes gene_type:complete
VTEIPKWRDLAECKGAPTEIFFPERGQSLEAAFAMCDCCAVVPECLESGMSELAGIWGGASRLERRRLLGLKVKPRVKPRRQV